MQAALKLGDWFSGLYSGVRCCFLDCGFVLAIGNSASFSFGLSMTAGLLPPRALLRMLRDREQTDRKLLSR